ncbi:MAG: hypothetical protein M1423_06800 [Acidobacteria bacterium]|nr:hypothetical protein [Acidobacteriota bacterium]
MSYLAWLADRCSRRRLQQATARELSALSQGPVRASRQRAHALLQRFRAVHGPKVNLGWTVWDEPVIVPLLELVKACGIITGGMGSGKTMLACLAPEALIRLLPQLRSMAIGTVDAKGEGFDRILYLLARHSQELDEPARENLLKLIELIDFPARHAISSYNILARWPGAEPDFFVTSRFETLKELLPSGDKLSLRGGMVLKNVLALLSEVGLADHLSQSSA